MAGAELMARVGPGAIVPPTAGGRNLHPHYTI